MRKIALLALAAPAIVLAQAAHTGTQTVDLAPVLRRIDDTIQRVSVIEAALCANGQGTNCGAPSPTPLPHVTGITPSAGGPGVLLTLTGTNLANPTACQFRASPTAVPILGSVLAGSATSAQCFAPNPIASGSYTVTLVTLAGTDPSPPTVSITTATVDSVAPQAASVVAGDSVQLVATVTTSGTPPPDRSVTWALDTTCASGTVTSSGLFTGVSAGSCVVRATSIVNPLVSGTATVRVTASTGGTSSPPATIQDCQSAYLFDTTDQVSVTVSADTGATIVAMTSWATNFHVPTAPSVTLTATGAGAFGAGVSAFGSPVPTDTGNNGYNQYARIAAAVATTTGSHTVTWTPGLGANEAARALAVCSVGNSGAVGANVAQTSFGGGAPISNIITPNSSGGVVFFAGAENTAATRTWETGTTAVQEMLAPFGVTNLAGYRSGTTRGATITVGTSSPASQLTAVSVALEITSGTGGGSGGGGTTPSVTSVSVSPSAASLYVSGTQQFAANVSAVGGASTGVTWSQTCGAGTGSITTGGRFTAPAVAATCTVTATSTYDSSKHGSATVTVNEPPAGGGGGGSNGTGTTYSPSYVSGITGGGAKPSTSGGTTLSGAAGNCSTDDTDAFRSSAAAAASTGKLIIPAPSGSCYRVTGAIDIPDGVSVIGVDYPTIRMYGARGDGSHIILNVVPSTSPIWITGLHLDGGWDGSSMYASDGSAYSGSGEAAQYSHAINLPNNSNVTVADNLIENTVGDNIYLGGGGGTSNVLIDGNTLKNAFRCAVAFINADRIAVMNSVVIRNGIVWYAMPQTLDFEPNSSGSELVRNVELGYNLFTIDLSPSAVAADISTNGSDSEYSGNLYMVGAASSAGASGNGPWYIHNNGGSYTASTSPHANRLWKNNTSIQPVLSCNDGSGTTAPPVCSASNEGSPLPLLVPFTLASTP